MTNGELASRLQKLAKVVLQKSNAKTEITDEWKPISEYVSDLLRVYNWRLSYTEKDGKFIYKKGSRDHCLGKVKSTKKDS